MLIHLALVLVTNALAPTPAEVTTHDWPQWRGPHGDNVSRETGFRSTPQPEPVWRADVGMGYSSPSIADGRLVIAGYFGGEESPKEGIDRVSCLDVETGAELWSLTYPALIYDNEHGGGTLSTATIVGDTVFVPTRSGEVRALDVANGEVRWEVDLTERHSVPPGRYGFASSPFILGPNIVLNAGRTVALDRATGETAWISESYDANYSTVAPIRLGERDCLAVFGAKGLVIIDASNGEHVHTYPFRKGPRNVEGATPIVMGESVIISSGYEQGMALVNFGGDEPEVTWRTRKMRNKMAGSTLFDGFLYGFDESMLKCLDLDGNERWRERGLGHGALSVADGRLLLTTSDGELIVAAATPEEFRVESRTPVIDGGVFWAAPVVAGGRIFVRGSLGDLVCLDHRPTRAVAGASERTLDSAEIAGALPSPADLRTRHREAMGLAKRTIEGLSLSGRLHVHALGLADVAAEWGIDDDGRWHTRFDLPPGIGGTIERAFDGKIGWESNPYRGNKRLEGRELEELVRTGGYRLLFDPLPKGTEARTVARETFRGTACYRVDVEVTPEVTRHVYFDTQTGLLRGRTAADEDTVLFSAWRETDGVLIPYHRTVFDSETGEESRWKFTKATFGPLDDADFEMPEGLDDAPPEDSAGGESKGE